MLRSRSFTRELVGSSVINKDGHMHRALSLERVPPNVRISINCYSGPMNWAGQASQTSISDEKLGLTDQRACQGPVAAKWQRYWERIPTLLLLLSFLITTVSNGRFQSRERLALSTVHRKFECVEIIRNFPFTEFVNKSVQYKDNWGWR